MNHTKFFEPNTDFSKPQPISGGDLYDKRLKYEARKNNALNSLPSKGNYETIINEVSNQLTTLNEEMFKSRLIQPWYLFQLIINQHTNQFGFLCNNTELAEIIIAMKRNTKINGDSALIIDEKIGKIYPVNVIQRKYDKYYQVTEFKYSLMSESLEYQSAFSPKDNKSIVYDFKASETRRAYLFKNGSMGISAWLTIWPYVLQLADILKVINSDLFNYVKKFALKLKEPKTLPTDLKNFFNLDNPFLIIASFFENEFANKIEMLELDNADKESTMFNYYNQFREVYNTLFGIRLNIDTKAERNIAVEVNANQEQFNDIQKEYENQFKIFISRVADDPVIKGMGIVFKYEEKEDLDKSTEQGGYENDNQGTENTDTQSNSPDNE